MEVSVIIPVYNAASFVEKAVNSALQLKEVKEILLIEDGSPDNALAICQRLEKEHKKVKLFQHQDKKNHGASASRNVGLKNANCPFIAFLDADDFFLPNRFVADKRVFDENPDADGVYNGIGTHFYSSKGEELFNQTFSGLLTTVKKNVSPEEVFSNLIMYRRGFGSFSLDGLTIKKTAIKKMPFLFDPNLRLHEDSDFIIRLSYYCKLLGGSLNEPVAMRGVHDHNQITNLRLNKRKFYLNQNIFWNSLNNWAVKEEIDHDFQKHLNRMKVSRSIACYNTFIAFFVFWGNAIKDPNILIKNIYYSYIHSFFLGNGTFSNILLKVKYKIQKELRISGEINF